MFTIIPPQLAASLAVLGLFLLFLAWQQMDYYPNILRNGTEAEGTVIEMHRDPGPLWGGEEGDGEAPVVEFTDRQGRQRRHFSTTYQIPSPYRVGQKVRIWYIIYKSRQVYALEDDTKGSWPRTLLIIGAVAFLLGAPELWRRLGGLF